MLYRVFLRKKPKTNTPPPPTHTARSESVRSEVFDDLIFGCGEGVLFSDMGGGRVLPKLARKKKRPRNAKKNSPSLLAKKIH